MLQDFLHTTLGSAGKPIHRVGLSASYRPGTKTIHRAIDEGINLLFCFGIDSQMISVMREIPTAQREKFTFVTGAYNLLWGHPNLRRTLEKRLRQLHTDYIDVFLFLGVTKPGQMNDEVFDEFARFKEEGKVKAIGLSTHDRKFAGELARQGRVDTLMIRYNAAHRGAERDVFPFLQPYNPGVISYTSTRWTYLMRRPKGWPRDRQVPTAPMAYRFVLSNPHVSACLMAPANEKHLKENLAGIWHGPLSAEEMDFMRTFGDVVYRTSKTFFSFADLRELRHRN
jgi:aryl-alcohol dehydrogenase-like predicted oxidoreductase